MGAQSKPLIIFDRAEIASFDDRTDEPDPPSCDEDFGEAEAATSQEETGDPPLLIPAAAVSRRGSGESHWLSSGMSAQSEPLIALEPNQDLTAVEPQEEPSSKSEDSADTSEARAPLDEANSEPQLPAASVPPGGRKFGVGALIGSAAGGAAVAIAVLLTFGISHGRWERAVDHDIYGEVVFPQSVAPTTHPHIAFAEASVAFEPAQAAMPGVHSTRPADSSAIGGDVQMPNEGEAERVAFSSLILGASFASNEVFVDGTALTNASPVIASDVEAARDMPIESEPAVAAVSFDDVELAAAFEASASPADGAVLSDGSGIISAPPMPASGTLVVDQASSRTGVQTMDAENAVITVPAGAKKVDAVLHLVTADGRIAYVSELSVVLGDKVRPATERQAPKAAPRKPVAPESKATTKAPKAGPAIRREAQRIQPLPPPPRGLFNFNGYQGPKKASAASSDNRGPAG